MKYRIHKTLAVSVGIFLAVWFISGITMVLPTSFFARADRPSAPIDFHGVSVSPAEAVKALDKILGETAQVSGLYLIRVRDSMVYKIVLRTGRPHLIDAQSGRIVTITPEVAEQIARDEFSTKAGVRNVVRLTDHDLDYSRGPLPVYRVVFEDRHGTISHVSIDDGSVRQANRWLRLRDRIIGFHTFHAFLGGHERLRKGLLLLVSLLGLAAVASGYYLALPGALRRRRASASGVGSN
jgi:hypothetical protein